MNQLVAVGAPANSLTIRIMGCSFRIKFNSLCLLHSGTRKYPKDSALQRLLYLTLPPAGTIHEWVYWTNEVSRQCLYEPEEYYSQVQCVDCQARLSGNRA